MAGEGDAKARFPRQEVAAGQKHDYLGDVEVYEPDTHEPGHSNAADKPTGKKGKSETGTTSTVTDSDTEQG